MSRRFVEEPTQRTGGQASRPEGNEAATQRLFTQRGVTIIAPSVVEKIATRAAGETPGVGGIENSRLRRLMPLSGGEREPQAEAQVERERTAVDLTISVRYPEPVRQVAERVRQGVANRVRDLTGLAVTRVNVTVPELVVGDRRERQRRVE